MTFVADPPRAIILRELPEIRCIVPMLSNYHTHTALCKHAEGMPVDYAREAVAHGFQVLGFSDHCPQPDDLWNTVRMDFDQMDTYFASIEEARATYPQLEIHAGFECEFRKDLGDFIPETFLRPGRAEYLLLALHSYLDADGQWQDSWHLHTAEGLLGYARHAVEALESGWFAAFAHPDVFAHGGCAWDGAAIEASRMILQAAQECRIPLELNCNGFHRKLIRDERGLVRRPYPYLPFWALAADYDVQVYVGADAHRPEFLHTTNEDCLAIAHYYGLQVIDRLPMRPAKQP